MNKVFAPLLIMLSLIILSYQMSLSETNAIFNWGKKKKIFFHPNIFLNPSSAQSPLPYFTSTETIPVNTTIISIPTSLFININKILSLIKTKEIQELWKKTEKMENNYVKYFSTKEMFFIALTIETYMRTHPKKNKFYQKYKKYFKFYQYYSFDNFPLYYSQDELSFLSGTNFDTNIRTAKRSIEEEIKIIEKELELTVIPDDYIKYRIVTLANSLLIDNTTSVIPFIDFFPYDKIMPYVKWIMNNETNTLDIVSLSEIPKNSIITLEAKKLPNEISLLYYGYTVDDNYLVPPFFIEVLSENLEKKIGLNSTINIEKSDYDIARETFDKNIIDSYRTICKNVKGCELDRDLGPYDLMKQNLEDYLKIYDRFTPGNFNINFFNQRKKENVMRVIEMEKQLIKNRITFISKKLEVIKSERGEL